MVLHLAMLKSNRDCVFRTRSAQVRYSESSMRNGFGLKLLHKFFNLPFLQLQKETLLRQLERNEAETQATIQELDIYCDSDDANYNKFLDNLARKRREVADSNANIPVAIPAMRPSVSSQQIVPGNQTQSDVKRSQSGPIVIGAGKPIPFGAPAATGGKTAFANSQVPKSFSHNFGFAAAGDGNVPDIKRLEINPITSVEEFCPDGGQIDRNFLDDVQSSPQSNANDGNESDR